MRRKPGTLLDNTLLRYLLSFLLVLLLPLVTFFLIYNRYFLSLYQNEVFERYQNEIVSLDREIVTHVQWMRNIAGQFTNQRTFRQEDIIEDAPGYSHHERAQQYCFTPGFFHDHQLLQFGFPRYGIYE